MVSLLHAGQGNAPLFREIRSNVAAVMQLLHSASSRDDGDAGDAGDDGDAGGARALRALVARVLPIVQHESGLPAAADALLRDCSMVVDEIDRFVHCDGSSEG